MAASAASKESKETKPKPFEAPVVRSREICEGVLVELS